MNSTLLSDRWARGHAIVALVVSASYAVLFWRAGVPPFWVGAWAVASVLAAGASFRPGLGIAAYAAVLYGTPRYSELFETLALSWIFHWLAGLAVSGTLLWLARHARRPRLDSPLLWLGAGLLGWYLLAMLAGQPAKPTLDEIRHSPFFFIQAVLLLFPASQVLDDAGAWRRLTAAIVAALAVRVLWEGAIGLNLEGDVGPLAIVMLPLCLLIAQTETRQFVRLLALVTLAGGVATAALTYNRASAVTFAVVLLFICVRSRRRPWMLAGCALCAAAAAFWLYATPYRARFESAWAELKGVGVGSVTERLDLWRAGWSIVTEHPYLGIGPANYPAELARRAPQLEGMAAHNSYVNVAAETGLPGALLYIGLFGAALVFAQSTVHASGRRGDGLVAAALQTSIAGYLAASFFISRHDMALAYVLVGWIVALRSRVQGPSTPLTH